MEEVSAYAKGVHEFEEECPYCGGRMKVRELNYALPEIGDALLVSRYCPSCGYRRSEMVGLNKRPWIRIYFRVSEPGDVNAKVVRSNVAEIRIPEIGATISPGAAAQMFLTNVEGVLERIEDALERLCLLEDSEDLRRGARRVREEIEALREVRREYTLVISDPQGISSVRPPRGGCGKVIVETIEGALA